MDVSYDIRTMHVGINYLQSMFTDKILDKLTALNLNYRFVKISNYAVHS